MCVIVPAAWVSLSFGEDEDGMFRWGLRGKEREREEKEVRVRKKGGTEG